MLLNLCALLLVAAPDPKQACLDSYVQAQVLKKGGQLRAARQALLICARPACPEPLPAHCAGWLTEVESRTPTVVIAARGPGGRDVTDVRVLADGVLLQDRVDGRAVAVDPGVHLFRYETPGQPPVEQRVLVAEGEKARRLGVAFGPPELVHAAPPPPPARTLPLVVGGAGVVSLGVAAYFGVNGWQARGDLDRCRPYCEESAVSDVRRKFLVADLTLALGMAAVAGATYLWLHRP
jgi:hypothetical protein